MKTIAIAFCVLGLLSGISAGQTNIDSANKLSWSENCGWMNWRDAGAPAGTHGARVGTTVLSGFIWGENVGWINVGDGTPGSGAGYANVNGSDFGLNLSPDGFVTGLAWGENIGWINFSAGALATPAQFVRLLCSGRFVGFAWSENVGWIDLSVADAGKHVEVTVVTTPRPCDMNGDGSPNGRDVQAFVNLLLMGGTNWSNVCAGDVEPVPDGMLDADDIPGFVACLLN